MPITESLPAAGRLAKGAVSAALICALCAGAPTPALASQATLDDALDQLSSPTYRPFSYAEGADDAVALSDDAETTAYATKYDLRDPNSDGNRSDSLVTPVKSQYPWGSCWSFAAISACETSILSRAEKDGKSSEYSASTLDLSEMQLALASLRNGGAPEEYVGAAQAGEGFHSDASDPNIGINRGGMMTFASSMFAAGVGPLDEQLAPYRNSELIKQCTVDYQDGTSATEYLTDAQIQARELAGATVTQKCWAGNYRSGGNKLYTTWAVDTSLWNSSSYEFENSNILPATQIFDANGKFLGVNWKSIANIKDEIQNQHRAVSCAFYADVSQPGQDGLGIYINTNTWAHYTYEPVGINHGVTIVGWDDDFPASAFGKSSDAKTQPAGNGAWLVKNSWGADGQDFPNNQGLGWGIEENGQHTGYFWLSYYDQTITALETFDFDFADYGDDAEYIIDQYDYLPQVTDFTSSAEGKISAANVYTAESDMQVRTLATLVAAPNTTVTYEVYLLDDEASSPTDPNHAERIFEAEELYQYGGYHRITLGSDASTWLALRSGQRYAVVTTQRCNDDGKYYITCGANSGKPSETDADKYLPSWREAAKRTLYKEYYQEFRNQNIKAGMSADEAGTEADKQANEKVATDEAKAEIEKTAQQSRSDFLCSYFVSKVNAGESWTTADLSNNDKTSQQALASEAAESGDAGQTWNDWSTFAASTKENTDYVVDNFSIKAYAEKGSYATTAEMDALKQAVAAAEAKLAAAKISADGSDVAAADTWMTQEQHDALAAAVAAAKEALEADSNHFATTPSSQKAAELTAALAFKDQMGTKAAGGQGSGSDAGNAKKTASASADAGARAGSGLIAETGDAGSPAAAGALLGTGAVAVAAAAATRRRRD